MEDVIIIGAGPCGLSAAAELIKRGRNPLLVDKGSVVDSIYHYPTYMEFFSTAEKLEIGDVPFLLPHEKPDRREALAYYRGVALRYGMRIKTYETVVDVQGRRGDFTLLVKDRFGKEKTYRCRHVIMATGYFGNPNRLGIPGEELPKVSHAFTEAHPYTGSKVAIIGGNNSAVDASLELAQVGAEITVVYRGDDYSTHIKPWVLPMFKSLVDKGRIRMLFASRVTAIGEDAITVETTAEGRTAREELANDFVLELTGYRPDHRMLRALNIRINEEKGTPEFDPDTMETPVPGLYVCGVIAAGNEANEIFIENGRHHGAVIAGQIAAIDADR